jgi:hypothetical protein
MMLPPKPPPDNPAQSERFLAMAKEVAAEEDLGAFERTFVAVANAPKREKSQQKVGKSLHTKAR